jgi:hypothetical protein
LWKGVAGIYLLQLLHQLNAILPEDGGEEVGVG